MNLIEVYIACIYFFNFDVTDVTIINFDVTDVTIIVYLRN